MFNTTQDYRMVSYKFFQHYNTVTKQSKSDRTIKA